MAQKKIAEETANIKLAITDDFSGYYNFGTPSHLGIGRRISEKMIPLLPNDNNTFIGFFFDCSPHTPGN